MRSSRAEAEAGSLPLGRLLLFGLALGFTLISTLASATTEPSGSETHHQDAKQAHQSSGGGSNALEDNSPPGQQPYDPFAFTFDDYLREASKSSSSSSSLGSTGSGAPGQHQQQQLHESSAGLMLVDEEEDSNSLIPAAASPQGNSNDYHHYETAPTPKTLDTNNHNDPNNTQQPQQQQQQDSQFLDEIKLLFAWKSVQTNRCSRPCGRGQLLMQLSCLDLKFNVRVEDELCQRARLPKPSELSQLACNEFDCAPQWQLVASSGDGGGPSGGCNGSTPADNVGCKQQQQLRRVECGQLTGAGQLVYLDESRCANSTSSPPPPIAIESQPATTGSPVSVNAGPTEQEQNSDHEFSLDELYFDQRQHHSVEPTNDILQSDLYDFLGGHQSPKALDQLSNDRHLQHQHPSNEPFLQPSDWSECLGAPCGQLGRRHRNLTCRVFLARSGKFADLPAASCQAAPQLHRDEPCYMDCSPGTVVLADQHRQQVASEHQEPLAMRDDQSTGSSPTSRDTNTYELDDELDSSSSSSSSNNNNNSNDDDELVYDESMSRFAWRHSRWSECSARCLGGGKRESPADCYDKITDLRVDEAHCLQQLAGRPAPLVEPCNVGLPCAPEWRLEPFGPCSRRCGSAGIRTRSVACVVLVPLESGDSDYMLVPNEQCLQHSPDYSVEPHKIEPCNRVDCPPEWQLGPWGECAPHGGPNGCSGGGNSSRIPAAELQQVGTRNRTVICVQEFASREGPTTGGSGHRHHNSERLREALKLAYNDWHSGTPIQVPAEECLQHHRYVPPISEQCLLDGANQRTPPCPANREQQQTNNELRRIDSDPLQDYRLSALQGGGPRRRTVTLKVGGRAQLVEGRNLKIRCRVLELPAAAAASSSSAMQTNGSTDGGQHYLVRQQPVEWRKDGQLIFGPNVSYADKQPVFASGRHLDDSQADATNSILDTDLLMAGTSTLSSNRSPLDPLDDLESVQADEPANKRHQKQQQQQTRRQLRVRMANTASRQQNELHHLLPDVDPQLSSASTIGRHSAPVSFQFVAQLGGRFSLVKENTLRIKKLRLDDSGLYTCSTKSGGGGGPQLSETLELTVISRRQQRQQLLNSTPNKSGAGVNARADTKGYYFA